MAHHQIKVAGKALPPPVRYKSSKKKKRKSSSDSSSDEVKVKKKKKPSTSLKSKVKDINDIASKFGVSTDEISRMIDNGDHEKAVGYFQKKMLAAIVQLIPLAEAKYKKYRNQSDAYALNALVSQARELAQDLQATGDRQKLALTIVQEVLMPGFRAIVQEIVDEHYNLKRDMEDYVEPKKVRKFKERVDVSGQRVARHAQKIYISISERINDMLVS